MREHFRSFDSKISFFAFADIITAVSGMLIFITLLLATDLGKPTDNRSQATAELERQLKETLTREAAADAENRNLQQLLATANTAPDPDKLEADIARLRAELADEQSKHAGLIEQLAASKSALEQQNKLLGITAVQEQVQQGAQNLESLADQDAKIHRDTAALEQQITSIQSKIVKLRQRVGQLWLIPDRSMTSKEPVLAITSDGGVRIERFNHPEQAKEFSKSGAHADFEAYLDGIKPANQYIVFLIRPSGIGMFKDLVDIARKKGFEVGFDALEENREIHFTAPPPLDDESVPARKQDTTTSAQPPATRSVSPAETNAPAAPEATAPATSPSTNPIPPPPPAKPPPQPKSWWQRLLEWLGITK